MKNKQTNVGSFATAKLQAISRRLIAIVALAVLIVFSMVACPDDVGGGGGGGGYSEGAGWPPSNVRSQYGIGGMSQPPGSGFNWVTVGADPNGHWTSAITIQWSPTSSTLSTVGNWFSSNGWSGEYDYYSDNTGVGGWYKGSQMATFQTYVLTVYNNYRN